MVCLQVKRDKQESAVLYLTILSTLASLSQVHMPARPQSDTYRLARCLQAAKMLQTDRQKRWETD